MTVVILTGVHIKRANERQNKNISVSLGKTKQSVMSGRLEAFAINAAFRATQHPLHHTSTSSQ